MPEARDRRATPLDVAAMFARRRASTFILEDLDPFAAGSAPTGPGATRNAAGRGRALALRGAPRVENSTPVTAWRGRGRAPSRSVLPAWYPRTPLRDITVLTRAIERRRVLLGESNEGERTPLVQILPDPDQPGSSRPGARLEHRADCSVASPSSVRVKIRTVSKVPKIVLDIATEEGEPEFLTPQKKLLDSIDTVEKIVREELQRLKRTPSAKKVEREKRVRTLMSMR